MKKRFLILPFAALAAWLIFYIPDWFKDPTKWVIGEWENPTYKFYASVDEKTAKWEKGGRRGKLSYQWEQSEQEPYRLIIRHGHKTISATLRFEGKDTVILEPNLSEHLDDDTRSYLNECNRLRNRPANEVRLLFRRVQEQQ